VCVCVGGGNVDFAFNGSTALPLQCCSELKLFNNDARIFYRAVIVSL